MDSLPFHQCAAGGGTGVANVGQLGQTGQQVQGLGWMTVLLTITTDQIKVLT